MNLSSEKYRNDIGLHVHQPLLTLSQASPCFHVSEVQVSKKHWVKEENAHVEQFLLFPQCFYSVFSSLSTIFLLTL